MSLLQIHEPGQTPLPHASEAGMAVGIDLGTTHSVVAVSDHGNAQVLRNIHGHALVPSVVLFKDGNVRVGFEAKAALDRGDAHAIGSFKRHMHEAATMLDIGGVQKSPVELSAEILKTLKAQAEKALGREVRQAVITVPAYFDDSARQATKDAARLAGLELLRLINEPTAAALAYGLDNAVEGIYAIYDFGGGTFDVSLLKLEKGVFQVLATRGDTHLGGDDIDRILIPSPLMGEGKEEGDSTVLGIVRKIKEQLSTSDIASAELPPTLALPHKGGGNISYTRADFEALIAPIVARTIECCKQALADAKLSAQDVKGVVMVGGSSRIPLVRREVEKLFGTKPLTNVNPDEVVAVGAAIQAEGLTRGSNNLLLDVIPLSLGLETMGGLFEKIIQRNTPIPIAATQEFTTYQDNQTGMQIHVYQGEREMAADNRSLAKFELTGIPPLTAGIARVKVTFMVDADGLLTVSAQEQTTGRMQHIEVKPSYGLPPEEMERMLRESMEHARADIMGRLLVEARVEAERAIIEIESAMKTDSHLLSEAEKKLIAQQMQAVRNAAGGADRDYIDAEVSELGRVAQNFAERRMNQSITKALKGKNIKEAT
ncbi:MAG: Fe-S protein assembly chaperone HscA [Alphaproteobacteria bacterium]|nr:Fe-S protein assembly chaperone HscA [Alphaproteobacteria bacterium]